MVEVIVHWDHCMLNHFQDLAFPNKYHRKIWIPSALVPAVNNYLEVFVRAPQRAAGQGLAVHHKPPQPGAGRHSAAPDTGHLPRHWDKAVLGCRATGGNGSAETMAAGGPSRLTWDPVPWAEWRDPWQELPPWAGGSWGSWAGMDKAVECLMACKCLMAWAALFSLSDKEKSMKPPELK